METKRRIYFLLKGKAKLSRIEEDDKEHYFNALVVALEKCMVGHIHEKEFNNILTQKPDLCLEVNKIVGARLIRIENRLSELLFRDVPCVINTDCPIINSILDVGEMK